MDYQALGVGLGAVITALGALLTGVYTGKSGLRQDEVKARDQLAAAKAASDLAVETATKTRIEALVTDAADARKRMRELEDEFDERRDEYDKRYNELRRHAQRGWDLASYHFGLVALLAHLLNNMLTLLDMPSGREDTEDMPKFYERLWEQAKIVRKRLSTINIPISLESPLDNQDNAKPPTI